MAQLWEVGNGGDGGVVDMGREGGSSLCSPVPLVHQLPSVVARCRLLPLFSQICLKILVSDDIIKLEIKVCRCFLNISKFSQRRREKLGSPQFRYSLVSFNRPNTEELCFLAVSGSLGKNSIR